MMNRILEKNGAPAPAEGALNSAAPNPSLPPHPHGPPHHHIQGCYGFGQGVPHYPPQQHYQPPGANGHHPHHYYGQQPPLPYNGGPPHQSYPPHGPMAQFDQHQSYHHQRYPGNPPLGHSLPHSAHSHQGTMASQQGVGAQGPMGPPRAPPPPHYGHPHPQGPPPSGYHGGYENQASGVANNSFYPPAANMHSMPAQPPSNLHGRPPMHPKSIEQKPGPEEAASKGVDQPTIISHNPSTDEESKSKKHQAEPETKERPSKKTKKSSKKGTPLATKEKAAIEAILSLGSSSSHDENSATSGSDGETASLTTPAPWTPPRRPSVVYTTGPGPTTFIPVQAAL